MVSLEIPSAILPDLLTMACFVLKTIPTITKCQKSFFLIAIQQCRAMSQTQCQSTQHMGLLPHLAAMGTQFF